MSVANGAEEMPKASTGAPVRGRGWSGRTNRGGASKDERSESVQ